VEALDAHDRNVGLKIGLEIGTRFGYTWAIQK
jgi:hypothetical protein